MLPFLIYEGKVAVALAVFYMFYRLLLKKETFHRLNRMVLVGMVVASFLLPLCIITIHKPMEIAPVGGQAPMDLGDEMAEGLAPMATATADAVAWWPTALSVLFFTGVTLVIGRVVISILSIIRIVRRGQLIREEDGCKIIVTDRGVDPFSWMRYIVLPLKDWEGQHDSIITHEKAHIAYGHSVELLLVDVLSAFQWFNPAIWMLRADLQELHEYEADDAVLRSGANLKDYQYLLIRKAVSKSGYSVANSFNHSILKNRITMMSKSKSPLRRGLRVLYLLPLVCLGIGLQAKTVYVPSDKDSEKIVQDEKSKALLQEVVVVKYANDSVNPEDIRHGDRIETLQITDALDADTMPLCSEKFEFWLNSRLKYPADCLWEGTVLVRFTVDKKGKVSGVNVLHGVCEELDNQVVNLIAQSPSWTPATKNGKPVAVQLIQPVDFMIRTTKQLTPHDESNNKAWFVLTIHHDGKIDNGGHIMDLSELKDFMKSMEKGLSQTTVVINAAPEIPMSEVEKLKDELRKIGALKVAYTTAETGTAIRRLPPTKESVEAVGGMHYLDNPREGMDKDNIFVVTLDDNKRVFLGDKLQTDENKMLQTGEDFLREKGKDAVVSFEYGKNSKYGMYVLTQLVFQRMYSDVRNEKALAVYGKSLQDLNDKELQEIYKLVPVSIVERMR